MQHILLVEPEKVLATTYREYFRSLGYSVSISSSAQSAIFAADSRCPQLIILELQLIGHSGIEFLYEFRSYPEWQSIPVIIHSVVPPTEFSTNRRLLSEQLGVSAYLYKPITTLRVLGRTSAFALQAGQETSSYAANSF